MLDRLWGDRRTGKSFASWMAYCRKCGINDAEAAALYAEHHHSELARRGAELIAAGKPLSEALPVVMQDRSGRMSAILKAGETAGCAGDIIDLAARYSDEDQQLKRQIREYTAYPATLSAALIIIATFIQTFVVPNFTAIYMMTENYNYGSPTDGAMLLPTLYGLIGPVATAIIVYALFFIVLTLSLSPLRFNLNRILLDSGGKIRRLMESSFISEFIGLMAQHGAPLHMAWQYAGSSSNDEGLSRDCKIMANSLQAGQLPAEDQISSFPRGFLWRYRASANSEELPLRLKAMGEDYFALATAECYRRRRILEQALMIMASLAVMITAYECHAMMVNITTITINLSL